MYGLCNCPWHQGTATSCPSSQLHQHPIYGPVYQGDAASLCFPPALCTQILCWVVDSSLRDVKRAAQGNFVTPVFSSPSLTVTSTPNIPYRPHTWMQTPQCLVPMAPTLPLPSLPPLRMPPPVCMPTDGTAPHWLPWLLPGHGCGAQLPFSSFIIL